MREYINIPESVTCRACKFCGSRPVIAISGKNEYFLKCPHDDNHFKTEAIFIDIDEWNEKNFPLPGHASEASSMIACYDSKLNYTFFLPA